MEGGGAVVAGWGWYGVVGAAWVAPLPVLLAGSSRALSQQGQAAAVAGRHWVILAGLGKGNGKEKPPPGALRHS